MALPLPVKVRGKTVQIQGMYDADKDTEDVFLVQDTGESFHMWYRPGKGWAIEPLTTPG